MDLPWAEVHEAMAICKRAGIRAMMITGDNAYTAVIIVPKIGMKYNSIINGGELEKISDQKLEEILATDDIFFARMASNQILSINLDSEIVIPYKLFFKNGAPGMI